MNYYFLAFLAIELLSLGYALARNGEPRQNYSFGWGLVDAIIVTTLLILAIRRGF